MNRYNFSLELGIQNEVGVMTVSVRDVAREAGVSVGTVSNVLNNPEKVARTTVERVRAAINALGFVRNDAARQLRAGRSRTIGLVVLDVRNPFFSDLARGAEELALDHQMSVLLANSDEDKAKEDHLVSVFEEQRVAGLLVSPVGKDFTNLYSARKRGIPIVLVDRKSPDGKLCSVSVDDVVGGQIAVEHLIRLGRRRIMFTGGPRGIEQVSDRLKGAKIAASTHPQVSLEFVETKSMTAIAGSLVGQEILNRRPPDRPDAIFAANDLLALGILQSLISAGGVRIPEEIAIVGYDDIPYASTAVVPLSSIRQPASQIGAKAVEILLKETEVPRSQEGVQIIFQPELMVRASSQG